MPGTLTTVYAWLLGAAFALAAGEEGREAAIEARLAADARHLASDEMGGRGLGTEGLDRAADFIAARFAELGLKTTALDGGPFQTFTADVRRHGADNRVDWTAIAAALAGQAVDAPPKDHTPPREPVEKPQASAPRVVTLRNVVAVLEGEGPRADETIVLGAHYDHLGIRPNGDGNMVVFNGANDNASGVVAMLEVARLLAARPKKLPRRVVLVAFTGEERGLLGSFHYVNHPPVPLEKTIAMINLDMVGRMQGDLLMTAGTGSCPSVARMIGQISRQHDLAQMEIPGWLTGSDHMAFYSCRIPAVHFMTTGGRSDYHRPSDDVQSLNLSGMRRIAAAVAGLTAALAEADERPEFVEDGWGGVIVRNAVRWWGRLTSKPADRTPKPPEGRNLPKTDPPLAPAGSESQPAPQRK